MSDYEQAVFISYAWGQENEEREKIVNQLDQSLQKRGLKIIRDKRDLGYKGSIRDFMTRIGEGGCVIVVLSDKYLRSKNCMFELVEIAENKQFADRIFPIILPDAKIYDAVDRINYIEFWEQEKAELNERIRTLKDLSNIMEVSAELNDYDRFRDEIDKLTSILKDMNSLTPDMLRDADFQQLYDALVERMSSSWKKTKSSDTSSNFLAKPATKKERKIMDPITLATAATSLLAPFIKKAETAALDKITEKFPESVGKVWDAITKKSSSIAEAASDLAKNPDDADNEVFFKKQLQKVLEKDQDFAGLLTDLLEKAKGDSTINIGDNNIVAMNNSNVIKGEINVRGGNISSGGNITFGHTQQTNLPGDKGK